MEARSVNQRCRDRTLEPAVIEQARCTLLSLTAALNNDAVKRLPLKFPHLQDLKIMLSNSWRQEDLWNLHPLKQLGLKRLSIEAFYNPKTWFEHLFDEQILKSPLSKTLVVLHIKCRCGIMECDVALERLAASCRKLRDVRLDRCDSLELLRSFPSLEVFHVKVLGGED